MRARTLFLLVLLLALAHADASYAQWTFAGFLGDAWTSSSTMTLVNASSGTSVRLSDVDYESQSWRQPLYWGVRAGRTVSPNRRWSVEFEYLHLKTFAVSTQVVQADGVIDGREVHGQERFDAIVERFALSHGVNLLLANVAFEQPIRHRLSLVARAGVGPTLPHVEATIDGSSRDEYTWGRVAVQGAVAIDWSVTRYLLLTIEAKRTYTHQRLDVGPTKVDAAFATTHVVAGVGVRLPGR
jgi:hypothetical protein